MNRRTIWILAALVVGMAAPATAHSFTDWDNPEDNHHKCTGTRDWFHMTSDEDPSMLKTRANLTLPGRQSVIQVYVHAPPHSEAEHQDPDRETPVGTFTMPGILWYETNELSGLQKNDYECQLQKNRGDMTYPFEVHSDDIIL